MEIFKLFADLMKNNGISSVIVLIFLAFISGGGVLVFRWADKNIKNMKFTSNEYKQANLYNHAIFNTINRNLSFGIHNLVIGERLREAIFRDFLIYKFTAVKNELVSFVERGDLEKMSNDLFKARLLDCIQKSICAYEKKALNEKIPDIVISKFNEWHSSRIAMIYDFLNDIGESDLFESNTIKTKIAFDFFVHLLNLTIVDAQKTLINLNGQLDDITYKGITSEKRTNREK